MTETEMILQEIHNQKELSAFYDTLSSLPEPKKYRETANQKEKISVILSADTNYSCFVALTGVSILYNTQSFIDFYVLSDGISDKDKNLIRQSFSNITSQFSLTFIECDAKKEFTQVNLPDTYWVKLCTCNRLLVPKLIPHLSRAIYLDVDLIVLDDIKKLWNENLNGSIFGCVPLLYDRDSTVNMLRSRAGIPVDNKYYYFNSGVMLIDYDRWRQYCSGNEQIIEALLKIADKIDTTGTPDEVVLNRFAYDNGGYCVLPHKYNVHPYYSYMWLKNNVNHLSSKNKEILAQYEKLLKKYNYTEIGKLEENPVVHHFYGPEKPWYSMSAYNFPIPVQKHFSDFWFYAKMTAYFMDIKEKFIAKKMCGLRPFNDGEMNVIQESKIISEEKQLLCSIKHILCLPRLKKKYFKYKLLSKITWGKKKEKYKKKKREVKQSIKSMNIIKGM